MNPVELPIGTEYLHLLDYGNSKSGKTNIYGVVSASSGVELGLIKWFGQWRQYCFYPTSDTIWNRDCLNAVAAVLDGLNKADRSPCKKKHS